MALFVLCLTALLALALRNVDHADSMDRWWLSARNVLRERLLPAEPVDQDIAIVGIDQKCYQSWPEPVLLWGSHFARAVRRLRLSGARVIVFDYIPQVDPADYVKASLVDNSFSEALHDAENVIWAKQYVRLYSDGRQTDFIQHPHESLLYANPVAALNGADSLLGFAEFPQGRAVVCSSRPVLRGDDVTLAARAVERYFQKPGELVHGVWRIPGEVAVPLRSDGTILPDFPSNSGYVLPDQRSDHTPFLHISLYDFVQQPDVPDSRLKGRIVFIGAMDPFGSDIHSLPFGIGDGSREADGVEIQAALTRALLRRRILTEPGSTAGLFLALAPALLTLAAFLRLRWLHAAFITLGIAAGWILLSLGLFCMGRLLLPAAAPLACTAVSGAAMIGYVTLSEERERRQVMGLWGRYQDPRLVDYLLRNPDARGGDGEVRPVTVLFADLKSFTQTVESLSPEAALQSLNRYLALIETEVLRQGGLIDKYLGDGLMAQWGAPVSPGLAFRSDHARAAVTACLEILKQADRLARQEPEWIHFGLRLTLHTGPVVFGWVGASRLEPTIIGDTVNVTSRLQETAKQMNAEFLISESTFAETSDLISIGQTAEVDIRGRSGTLKVMEVTGPAAGPAPAEGREAHLV